MKVFIYACEGRYGGLHGIEDYIVEEFDNDYLEIYLDKDGKLHEGEFDRLIWNDWISEMSYELTERYGLSDDDIDYGVDGYWVKIKDDIQLSTFELNKEAARLGPNLFKKTYCE